MKCRQVREVMAVWAATPDQYIITHALRLRAIGSMNVERRFVSVGVNRVVNALDWGEDGRVVYGGHHRVVVYDPKVRTTATAHAACEDSHASNIHLSL